MPQVDGRWSHWLKTIKFFIGPTSHTYKRTSHDQPQPNFANEVIATKVMTPELC